MIGILDSGLGGLSVLKEVVRLLPTQEILYYADTAHCPYGGRSQGEICDLTHLAVERLVGLGAELVVLACNTMTGASVVSLREYYGDRVSIVGMVPALKPALALTRS
ncbi:MAG: glutamate racemase, partial [Rikenellaceae bacterium]